MNKKNRPFPFNPAKGKACPACTKWATFSAAEVLAVAAAYWSEGEQERCLRGFCPKHEVEFAAAFIQRDSIANRQHYCPNCGRCLDKIHGRLYCSDLCKVQDMHAQGITS